MSKRYACICFCKKKKKDCKRTVDKIVYRILYELLTYARRGRHTYITLYRVRSEDMGHSVVVLGNPVSIPQVDGLSTGPLQA